MSSNFASICIIILAWYLLTSSPWSKTIIVGTTTILYFVLAAALVAISISPTLQSDNLLNQVTLFAEFQLALNWITFTCDVILIVKN